MICKIVFVDDLLLLVYIKNARHFRGVGKAGDSLAYS
jgi:hypothetical protein